MGNRPNPGRNRRGASGSRSRGARMPSENALRRRAWAIPASDSGPDCVPLRSPVSTLAIRATDRSCEDRLTPTANCGMNGKHSAELMFPRGAARGRVAPRDSLMEQGMPQPRSSSCRHVEQPDLWRPGRAHLAGIAGAGMRSLARVLLEIGWSLRVRSAPNRWRI